MMLKDIHLPQILAPDTTLNAMGARGIYSPLSLQIETSPDHGWPSSTSGDIFPLSPLAEVGLLFSFPLSVPSAVNAPPRQRQFPASLSPPTVAPGKSQVCWRCLLSTPMEGMLL